MPVPSARGLPAAPYQTLPSVSRTAWLTLPFADQPLPSCCSRRAKLVFSTIGHALHDADRLVERGRLAGAPSAPQYGTTPQVTPVVRGDWYS